MITVRDIGQKHGYTGHDHLLSDADLKDMIGRSFRSIGDLRRNKAVREAEAPVEVLLADGTWVTL